MKEWLELKKIKNSERYFLIKYEDNNESLDSGSSRKGSFSMNLTADHLKTIMKLIHKEKVCSECGNDKK